jgi:4-hydroxy-tetrahydrodipicolinate reductase
MTTKHEAFITKIAVAGALGRMGRAVMAAAIQDPNAAIVGGWERPGHAGMGQDLGVAAGLPALGIALGDRPSAEEADVIIDFTNPAANQAVLAEAMAAPHKPALVIGTTGFEAAQLARITATSKSLRVVMASNYSVGMNLMWKALELVARVTGEDYDVEVIEAHHNQKKDSPSGTAITTAQVLARALHRDLAVWARYGRPHGDIGPRDPHEIGLHTVRGGDIVGDHTVLFAGAGERLEFKHQAHSRENFARGALKAAHWLALKGREPGLYTMAQVLGLDPADTKAPHAR